MVVQQITRYKIPDTGKIIDTLSGVKRHVHIETSIWCQSVEGWKLIRAANDDQHETMQDTLI